MARLDIYRNMKLHIKIKVDRESLLIGRGEQCDIILADPTVSRRHARISLSGDKFTVENFSRNGTRLNAAMVDSPMECDYGDRLYIGDFAVIIQRDDAPTEDISISMTIQRPPLR